jgi:hypothetical protein
VTTETAPAATPEVTPAPAAVAAVQPAISPAAVVPEPAVAAKPEGLDDYWDDKAGLKVDALKADLTTLKELKTFKAEQDIRLQGVPAKPEEYKIDLSGIEVPEGMNLQPLTDDDPFVGEIRGILHEAKVPVEHWNKLTKAYTENQIRAAKQWNDDMAAARTKLGDNADARISAVETALIGRLGDKGKSLIGTMVSAEAVEAFEALLRTTSASGPGAVPPGGKPKVDMEGLSTTAKFAHFYANSPAAPPARKSN